MRVKTSTILMVIFLLIILSCAKDNKTTTEPDLNQTWSKTFGSEGNENVKSIELTNDGNFVILGYSTSTWLIKIDESGNTLWDNLLSSDGYGRFIKQANDGSFIIGGGTSSYGTGRFNLIKTDESGNIIWEMDYIGENNQWEDEGINGVYPTDDNGYMFVGTTCSFSTSLYNYEILLAKVNSNGDLLWHKTFPGPENTTHIESECFNKTNDGGYIIAGYTNSSGSSGKSILIIKTDSSGNLLWQQEHLLSSNEDDYIFIESIQETIDGGFILSYYLSNDNTDRNYQLMKTTQSGSIEWTRIYGGPNDDIPAFALQTNDGGYAIVGGSESFGNSNYDFWLVKTDEGGNQLWESSFGNGTDIEWAISFKQTTDNGFIIVGNKFYENDTSDIYVVKTDENGDIE